MATAPSIDVTDWLALKTHVDKLVTTPAMAIYEPGAIVTPTSDAIGPLPYVLLSDVVNDPDRGGRIDPKLHVRSGTLLLTIQWPIARPVTHAQLKEIAGQIAAHFPADQCMSYGQSRLRVTQDASALQPFVEGAYRVAVVRVAWQGMGGRPRTNLPPNVMTYQGDTVTYGDDIATYGDS